MNLVHTCLYVQDSLIKNFVWNYSMHVDMSKHNIAFTGISKLDENTGSEMLKESSIFKQLNKISLQLNSTHTAVVFCKKR